MECKYCGAKLRDGANFCPKCGRKVKPVMPGGARPGPEADLTGRKTKQKAQTEPSKRQTLPQAENGLSGQKMTDDVEWTGVALSSGQDSSQKRKKGCLIAGIAGAVILAAAAAAIVFLWKSGLPDSLSALPSAQQEAETEERKPEEDFLEDEAAAESAEESWEEAAAEAQEDGWPPENVELAVPGAKTGDYEAIQLEENEEGKCVVTPGIIREYFPEATTCYFDDLPRLGEDIDDYIKNSYVFASFIKRGIDEAYTGEGNRFERDPRTGVYLLLFQWKDGRPYLTGYFAGVPEEREEGKWLFKVTPCEYDLTELYETENASFQQEKDDVFVNYIAPEDVKKSGAAYYLAGFTTRKGDDVQKDDCQKYRLWYQLPSDHVENYALGIERFESQTVSPERQRCYLLLDEDHEAIGYTVLTEDDLQTEAGRAEEDGAQAGSGEKAAGGEAMAGEGELAASGDYTAIYVHAEDNGNCRVNPDLVRQYIPDSTASCFTGSPDLGDNIEDYLRDSYTFADLISRGLENGLSGDGSSFNPIEDPDSTYCLLVFQRRDNHPYLTGYYFGKPERYDEDTWLLKVTPCDYDLEEIYERELKQYQEEKEILLANYIAPEDVEDSGAVYYVEGYNTGRSSELQEDECQLYHLWSQMSSPYLERLARPIGRMAHDVNKTREGRWKGFILMDQNYEAIGYTVVYGGDE